MPVNIDGNSVTEITIDGEVVQEITMDGDVVYDASGSTTTPTVIEDWESNDPLSNWNGNTSECSIDTSNAISGEQCVAMGTEWLTTIYAFSSDLNAVPSQGDKFEYYVRHEAVDSQCDSFVEFARQDSDHFYTVHTDTNSSEFLVRKGYSGGYTNFQVATFDYTPGEWYKVEVLWDDGSTFGGSAGDITARLYTSSTNYIEVSGNDTEWSTGDVQLRADKGSAGNRVWYDGWQITN